MSTSANLEVALNYSSAAEHRLIFKVHTASFMDRGAELTYLSAFPGEVEYLYPPLSFLKPTATEPQKIEVASPSGGGTVVYTVIEVTPSL